MPINPETSLRKSFVIPKALWARIHRFRFNNEIGTESEAIRQLLEAGLDVRAPLKDSESA